MLEEQYFSSQVKDQESSGHEGYEHYRYGAFIHWLRTRDSATDQEIAQFLELTLNDTDVVMGGSAAIELLKCQWITDAQFEKVCTESRKFGKWPLKQAIRYRLLRELCSNAEFELQARCLDSGDSIVHEALLELQNIDESILKGLSENGANKRIKNIAKNQVQKT
ncbi:hypothetical protein ACRRS0_22550 [Agarivorans sp. QJM3NY_29]|uniref:hypothetical protein n=1 Tax=unclassified Agarivorans TaxID=2636026 RepID=UPI003D7E4594